MKLYKGLSNRLFCNRLDSRALHEVILRAAVLAARFRETYGDSGTPDLCQKQSRQTVTLNSQNLFPWAGDHHSNASSPTLPADGKNFLVASRKKMALLLESDVRCEVV